MRQVLDDLVQNLQHLYGSELVSVFLYGSAATGEHVPGRSDINVAVVLTTLTPPLLRRASGHLRGWARRGLATPVFFDTEFIHDALDVFPIEMLDMQERHRTLWGPDLLAGLHIEIVSLRGQCEQELRGKLMKLRQAYVESSQSPKDLEAVLVSVASGLVVLARTVLHLKQVEEHGGAAAVFESLETQCAVRTAHLRQAWRLKRGEVRVTGSELDLLYQGVLEEFQQLVRVVDALPA